MTQQRHGSAHPSSLSTARANTYLLGLSLSFVVCQHRKSRFKTLGEDQKHHRTQCKTAPCGYTAPDLSCHWKLPPRPPAAAKLPVQLHRLVCSCSSYWEASQLPIFFWLPISLAARSFHYFLLSFSFPDQSGM